jgi:sugar lactone lactonase YvrE
MLPVTYPGDVAINAAGKLYVSDCSHEAGARILTMDSSGGLTVYAGGGFGFDGDGGPAAKALFFCILNMTFDSTGNLYFVDGLNARVRRIEPNGTINTVAGSGPVGDFMDGNAAAGGFAGDGGPATAALLAGRFAVGAGDATSAIALDQQGNLYILDNGNLRVRKVDQAGIITTIAGNGTWGFSGDGGPATAAEFGESNGIAVDAAGNVYIADTDNARIRKVDLKGVIHTIAGTSKSGFAGDGGPAAKAQLSAPRGMAIDAAGNR